MKSKLSKERKISQFGKNNKIAVAVVTKRLLLLVIFHSFRKTEHSFVRGAHRYIKIQKNID